MDIFLGGMVKKLIILQLLYLSTTFVSLAVTLHVRNLHHETNVEVKNLDFEERKFSFK